MKKTSLWKRFVSWLLNIFRKTKFDNKLFKMGVEELRKQLKVVLSSVEIKDIYKLENIVKDEINKKFGNVKVISNFLDIAIESVSMSINSINVFTKTNITKYINLTCDNLIKWYDAHL